MTMSQTVIVFRAPGHEDEFRATLVPGLHEIVAVDSRGPLTVVADAEGDVFVIPSRHVFTPEGLQYAQEWATKCHLTVFDVRIPDALRVGR